MGDFGDPSLFVEFDQQPTESKFSANGTDMQWNEEEDNTDNFYSDANRHVLPDSAFKMPPGLEDDAPGLRLSFLNDARFFKHRSEIERFLGDLFSRSAEDIAKGDAEGVPDPPSTSHYLGPEDSANPNSWQTMGCLQFYSRFFIDSHGHPLVKLTHELTTGWDIPHFERLFEKCFPPEEEEGVVPKGIKRGRCCFNCGSESHGIADCPKPKDMKEIQRRKAEVRRQNNVPTLSGNKATLDVNVDPRFKDFQPGVISESLKSALGCGEKQLPSFVYKMRMLGYPPGWLEEAKLTFSGLTMYEDEGTGVRSDGVRFEDGQVDLQQYDQAKEFQLSKLVSYPGFNAPMPPGFLDESSFYGVPRWNHNQSLQTMRRDFAARNEDLKRRFGVSDTTSSGEDETAPGEKRQRTRGDSDMDISEDEHEFRPPLPPGTPPPPTPPAPLPTYTPPLTPKNSSTSNANSSSDWLKRRPLESMNQSEAADSEGIVVEDYHELEDGEMSPSPPPPQNIEEIDPPSSPLPNGSVPSLDSAPPADASPSAFKCPTSTPIPAYVEVFSPKSNPHSEETPKTPASPSVSLNSISMEHSTPIPCRFDLSGLEEKDKYDGDDSVGSRFIESDPCINPVMPTPDQWAKNVSEHMDFVNLPETEGRFEKIKKILQKKTLDKS